MRKENEMKHWKLGSVSGWSTYGEGELKQFTKGQIKFKVMGNCTFEVWDQTSGLMVGKGTDDIIDVEFISPTDAEVLIKFDKKGVIQTNIRDTDQTVEKVYADENFVNLNPRVAQNPDFVRMENILKLQKQQFDAQLAAEKARTAAIQAAAEPVVEAVEEAQADDTGDVEAAG
jgi:hypothetical protein